MKKPHKIERTQKAFLKAMKKKFAEDPTASSRTLAEQAGTLQVRHPQYYDHLTLVPYQTTPWGFL